MKDNIIKFSDVESWSEDVFEFPNGSVTLQSSDEHLTLERALWLLESAKHMLMTKSFADE